MESPSFMKTYKSALAHPSFGGPPKFIKRGKNVVHVRVKTLRFSSEQLPGHPPPLSEILYPPLPGLTWVHSVRDVFTVPVQEL